MMPPPSSVAVVPRRPLRRLPVAFEHPVAELAAHGQDAAEEAAVDQPLQLEQAGQQQLVLHDAVLDAGSRRRAGRAPAPPPGRRRSASRSRCACRPRSPCARRRRARSSSASRNKSYSRGRPEPASRSVLQRSMPCLARQRLQLAAFRPTRIGSGMSRVAVGEGTPPWLRMATIERMRCWFVPIRPVTPFMITPTRFTTIPPHFAPRRPGQTPASKRFETG